LKANDEVKQETLRIESEAQSRLNTFNRKIHNKRCHQIEEAKE